MDEMQADLLELDDATAQKFILYFGNPQQSVEIECIPSNAERGLLALIGGQEYFVSLTLIVKRSVFVSVDWSGIGTMDSDSAFTADASKPHPIAGKKVQFRGKNYKVGTCSEDPSRAYYRLNLVDLNSGK